MVRCISFLSSFISLEGSAKGEQRRRIELDIQQSLNIDKVGKTETYKLQSDRLLFRRLNIGPSVRLETVNCSLTPRLRVESNDGRQWDSVHGNYSHCGYWIARVSVQLSKSYKKNKLSEKCCSNKPIHWTQLSWDFWWILLLCKINLVIKEQFVLMKLRRSVSRIVFSGEGLCDMGAEGVKWPDIYLKSASCLGYPLLTKQSGKLLFCLCL